MLKLIYQRTLPCFTREFCFDDPVKNSYEKNEKLCCLPIPKTLLRDKHTLKHTRQCYSYVSL